MKTSILFCALAAALALATAASAQTVEKETILSRHEAGSLLEIRDLKTAADGTVSGTLFNNSSTVLRDVKLLVRYAWIWKNERHPGDDNPGRSQYLPISGDIAARASMPFTYTPSPPLPSRTDGSFQTTVSVQGFTQVGE